MYARYWYKQMALLVIVLNGKLINCKTKKRDLEYVHSIMMLVIHKLYIHKCACVVHNITVR